MVAKVPQASVTLTLDGWKRRFLDGMGAPSTPEATPLSSWTADPRFAVRFYSGRAVYSRDVHLPDTFSGRRSWLDLGRVGEMARVRVNGNDLGVVWTSPYRVEISRALRVGRNSIEIEVANYWRNRIVGDRQPGAKPQTMAPITPFDAATPLRDSGLLGPVTLLLSQ